MTAYVHWPRHGIARPDRAPLLSVPRALRHRRLPAPRGRDFRPALISALGPAQRHHRVRVAGGSAQPAGPPPSLAAGVRVGTEPPGARRVDPQAARRQHPPHPPPGVLREPRHRHATRTQRPAAGSWPPLPCRHCRAGRRARPRPQGLTPVLLHGLALLKETADALPRVGGPRGRSRPRLQTLVTSPRACPGPAASALPAAPRHAASRPPQSLVPLRTARAWRDGKHDHDSVLALAARAVLASTFVGLPSRCSGWLRWFYITDFDRQSSSARAKRSRTSTHRH
jgi:hypothetical protein